MVTQMHTIENMYATLIMLGATLIFVTIGGYVYVRFYEKKNELFWLSVAILIVVYMFVLYGSQLWCIDMGWISPSDSMTNLTIGVNYNK